MLRKLDDYRSVVGDSMIADLYRRARPLYKKHFIKFNSTFLGGGVAEILIRLVPMLNDTGVDTGWRVVHGNSSFYDITKKIHNGMQGGDVTLSDQDKSIYLEVNAEFASYTHLVHDCVIVHDPQPLPLIKYYKKHQPWVWRCHIDISEPNPALWDFLKGYMMRYDVIIVSSEKYKKASLPVEQRVIPPAIDPLSMKNRDMPPEDVAAYIKSTGIPTDKPIITQVSRMDKWKDPEGVLKVFEIVKKKVDCRLLYVYNLASDDPEGMEIYERINKKAADLVKRGDVLFVMGNNEFLVNAIQRHCDVIIQKSTREGFCLAITEALWKGKPVVASRVGGIPLQIQDGETGYLLEPDDYSGFADRIITLLKNPSLAQEMGKKAREFVRKNFLVTRLMENYLDLLTELTA